MLVLTIFLGHVLVIGFGPGHAITSPASAEEPDQSQPEVEWNKTYGSSGYDHAHPLIQTSDGGYVLVGYTWPYSAGNIDFWLVKFSPEEMSSQFLAIHGRNSVEVVLSKRSTSTKP